jgi:uncharacterized protein
MKKATTCLLFVCALFTALPVTVRAEEDLGAIKTRMTQRVAKIDELKTKGVLGENNVGLLEVRNAAVPGVNAAEVSAIVGDENKDRQVVYAALAAKANVTYEQMSKARAKAIATNSVPGVWLQKESGDWYKK